MRGANTARLGGFILVVVGGSLLHEGKSIGWLTIVVGALILLLVPDASQHLRGRRKVRYASSDSSDGGWDTSDGDSSDGGDGGGDGGGGDGGD